MTQLRREPDNISNHFDSLFRGLGHRGSSFTNLDGMCHDGKTHRFLMLEFKHEQEELNAAVRWSLSDLARLPKVTVWVIWKLPAEQYGVRRLPDGHDEMMSASELQGAYTNWWKGT
jgi:hypothetical protein